MTRGLTDALFANPKHIGQDGSSWCRERTWTRGGQRGDIRNRADHRDRGGGHFGDEQRGAFAWVRRDQPFNLHSLAHGQPERSQVQRSTKSVLHHASDVVLNLVSRAGSRWDKSGDPDGGWQGAVRSSYRVYSQGRQRRQAPSGRWNYCADFWRGTLVRWSEGLSPVFGDPVDGWTDRGAPGYRAYPPRAKTLPAVVR